MQNVNAQTWQAPLYEVQTQQDAEKMMIAYREFLYEYFYSYRKRYGEEDDKRPMHYPIVYPDMSIDIGCAMVAFQNETRLEYQLWICRVPSFEYYGRMFDMIPWLLHEASHSIRALKRDKRNEHLERRVMRSVFTQAMYKLLNKYSNDFGYHKLGELENDVLDCVVEVALKQFAKFCEDKKKNVDELGIALLETELLEFLFIIFDKDNYQMEEMEGAENIKAIKRTFIDFLEKLNICEKEVSIGGKPQKAIELVEQCIGRADILNGLLECIYNAYYLRMTGGEPDEAEWKFLKNNIEGFERLLSENLIWHNEKKTQGEHSYAIYCRPCCNTRSHPPCPF